MTRLIDADALHLVCNVYDSDAKRIIWEINHAPTVDAVPVRHAKWIAGESDGHVRCSFCGKDYDWTTEAQYYNFCPTCGRWMGEE